MTREEAIRIQKWLYNNTFLFTSTENDVKQSTEMAIQALEKEQKYCDRNICLRNEYNGIGCDECEVTKSQESCTDAISRKQCIDAVNKILAQYVPKIYLYTLPLELEKAITDLPSISTEKVGRWIEQEGYYGDTYYDCSECGESFCLIDGTPTDNLYNYCPNCGCRMGEDGDKD